MSENITNSLRKNIDTKPVLLIIVMCLAITLNHSQVIFGVNISFADIFVSLLFIYLLFQNKLTIPPWWLFFVAFISISNLFSAIFVVPIVFNVYSSFSDIGVGYLKLLVNMFYLLMGYNLVRINGEKRLLKYYSVSTVAIGGLSLLVALLNIPILRDTMLYDSFRLRGFMNDPNYFSVLQTIGLVYFLNNKTMSKRVNIVSSTILILSILMSASKTGTIAMIVILCFVFFKKFISKDKNIKTFLKITLFLILIVLSFYFLRDNFQQFFEVLTNEFPSINRISVIFTDFSEAISTGGSGRDDTWNVALKLIKDSPLFGVGVGTYINVATGVYNFGGLSHNTYLQLAAEWGLPITVFFFGSVFLLVIKNTTDNDKIKFTITSMLFVLLIGSLAVSLNNARIFWILLGVLIYYEMDGGIKWGTQRTGERY